MKYTRPDMILFDYGKTLVNEVGFDPIKGNAALLLHAVKNPDGLNADDVQRFADEINREIGRGRLNRDGWQNIEIPNIAFQRLLYESLGIELDLSPEQAEQVFWDNAVDDFYAADGINELLELLYKSNIRTGVVSNMTNSGRSLERRINACIPNHHFEFIMASSEYVFRKPNAILFNAALKKAGLPPERVWYCGDNFICDVRGAAAVGITPVWYKKYADYEQSPDDTPRIEAESWAQLAKVLEL